MTTSRRNFLGGAGAAGMAFSALFEQGAGATTKTGSGGTTQVVTPGYLIANGDLAAEFRGNEMYPNRLSGVNTLFHVAHPTVNAYDGPGGTGCGGLNYEHIISGTEVALPLSNQFTPRSGPFLMSIVDPTTVRLTRLPQDEPWRIGATLTYHMVAPHYIDLDVRLRPTDVSLFGPTQYIAFMFANYMSPVADAALHFRGVTGLGQAETWIAADATDMSIKGWNQGGTYIHEDAFPLTIGPGYSTACNLVSYPWPRFTKPFYYGRSRNNMVYQIMLDRSWSPQDECRLTQFHYKLKLDPLNPRPAWDFQYVVHHPVNGQEYGFKARAMWKPWVSADDCLAEYENWRAAL